MMSDAATKRVIETPLLGVHKRAGAAIGTWFGCALPDNFHGAADRSDFPDATHRSDLTGAASSGDVGDWLAEYRAARESVALIDKNYRAYLRFTGPDRVRYLNAILTNNIKDLAVGNGVVSLFLNPQGRIQAEIETYAMQQNLFCVTYAMIRETLVPALDKFIIMDDVTLSDETELFGTVALEGPAATDIVKKLTSIDLVSLGELSFQEVAVAGISCGLTKRSPGGVAGAEFLAKQEELPQLWETLREAVETVGGRAIGYQALNALRLEQGIPWFGYDFGDKQIPHEAGLEHSHISYTKGCYTGQEIVERVRSRGQVNRVRVLVKFDTNEPPAVGTTLMAAGKEAGHVTRTAFSPTLQTTIGMAYVRREKSNSGTQLDCGGTEASVLDAPVAGRS
jgi:folate-binding protein YgfZ